LVNTQDAISINEFQRERVNSRSISKRYLLT
jgi:hypothetical protein